MSNETKKTTTPSVADEAKALGVKGSRIDMTMYNDKKGGKKVETESAGHQKQAEKRLENRVAKAKAKAKIKPIEARKSMLTAKLKSAKDQKFKCRWSDRVLKTFVNELKVINSDPKLWIKATKNGNQPYPIVAKKKKTILSEIADMDLD